MINKSKVIIPKGEEYQLLEFLHQQFPFLPHDYKIIVDGEKHMFGDYWLRLDARDSDEGIQIVMQSNYGV